MAPQYFVQGIFATAGLIALLASILNWNWFFTAQNAQLIVRNVGRGRARLFYGLLGVIMIGMGCLLLPQYATRIRVTGAISFPDIY